MAKFVDDINIFDEIAKLIEYIPLDTTVPSDARFPSNVTLDSRFKIPSIKIHQNIFPRASPNQISISFRDIVRIFSVYIKSGFKMELVFHRYHQLREIGCSYPVEYLLFDYALAALDGDYLDAKLYLAHSYHILGFRSSFNIILSALVNDFLTQIEDMREFLLVLAKASEPKDARSYIRTYGVHYAERYETYLSGLSKMKWE
jgi:hypothetical protein